MSRSVFDRRATEAVRQEMAVSCRQHAHAGQRRHATYDVGGTPCTLCSRCHAPLYWWPCPSSVAWDAWALVALEERMLTVMRDVMSWD
jgi:hypothetical protein